ncbi:MULTISPECIES: hypothetical protein [Bacteria]|uniref:Uncharacterized protein n=1 Tax=Bacillus cereus VD184 TaxID=1053242 RepID=A0A9W5RBE4_BACCE|nr:MULTISPECIES: hypothetical protein [Bacteria]EOQ19643.1 hypothetical protein IKC_04117 [Bacillus cereus VD184]MDQ4680051.1 hypothetical protein [Stenotrophomonas maltophilia group sp. RNC7]
MRLIYTKKGESFSDYQINIMLNKKKETAKMLTTKTEMKINNAIVIAIVQMYIKEGILKANDVVVEFEGNEYYFDDNGFTSLPLFTDYLSQVIKIGESLLVSTNTLRRQQLLC